MVGSWRRKGREKKTESEIKSLSGQQHRDDNNHHRAIRITPEEGKQGSIVLGICGFSYWNLDWHWIPWFTWPRYGISTWTGQDIDYRADGRTAAYLQKGILDPGCWWPVLRVSDCCDDISCCAAVVGVLQICALGRE